ncbi:MAG: AAA family ATPase [Lachnospiraceae bacterium]|nr:AAA family ATPase [Lachnospiraceae bacterium]
MAYNGGTYGYIDNTYPCGIFSEKEFNAVLFSPITVFYGGNGSGKTTLLNLISQKLQLNRIAPFNSSELFESYVENCMYTMYDDEEGFPQRIPNGSRIISSDDIFDYMLTVRTNNLDIAENIETARNRWGDLRFGETVKMQSMDDYEALRLQILARSKSVSRRKFIRKTVGEEVKLNSNGETALEYFKSKLKHDTLYCLDEPENSLSPKLQLELKDIIEEKAHYCGCQFIIATHSPFLLAMNEDFTKIYDLDSSPVISKKWWNLENTRTYFAFFNAHRNLFICNQEETVCEAKKSIPRKKVSKIHYRHKLLNSILGRPEKLALLIGKHMSAFSDGDMREVEAKWLIQAIGDLTDEEAIDLINRRMEEVDYTEIIDGNWVEKYKSEGISVDLSTLGKDERMSRKSICSMCRKPIERCLDPKTECPVLLG